LRGPDAPENILFDIAPIDGRFPSMEDGLSWIEIWRRYSVTADTGGFLWLRRRVAPADIPAPRAFATSRAHFNVPFAIPALPCEGIIMQVLVSPTIFNRVKMLLWKGPELTIQVPGERHWFRLLPGMVGSGFLLSPVVKTREQFAEFMRKGAAGAPDTRKPRSVTLRLATPEPQRYFAPEFTVRFLAVQPPAPACDSSLPENAPMAKQH